jgi:DNA repair protein SbcC/Rad50
MRIKNLRLKNIRSYEDQSIEFPGGSVLLSGDIGCGKSSILYAIDFALFGITKDLSGGSLLRHGEKEGEVELHFDVDGKDVVITRTLKQGKGVTQDAGSLVIDGKKSMLTALELKQKILELLQYPPELLTKKSLIYRYTVYTPQDEMKSILLGDDRVRLDTLRKVFGIDKYQRMKKNGEVFLKLVKQRVKVLQERVYGLAEKNTSLETLRTQEQDVVQRLSLVAPRLSSLQGDIQTHKTSLEALDKDVAVYREGQKAMQIAETALHHHKQQMVSLREDLPRLETDVQSLQQQIGSSVAVDSSSLQDLQGKITKIEEKIQMLRSKMQECHVHIAACNKNIVDISSLDVCPLCQQSVDASHVAHVKITEEKKISDHKATLESYQSEEALLKVPLDTMKQDVGVLEGQMKKQELVQFQQKTLEEKQQRLVDLRTQSSAILEDVHRYEGLVAAAEARVSSFRGKENEAVALKQRLDGMLEEEKKVMMKKVKLEHEQLAVQKDLERVQGEITQLKAVEMSLQELVQSRDWIGDCFLPMLDVMERQVMLKVHHDFDELFQKWLMMLVDSEVMKVRLDDGFRPVVEQNGHETEYGHLSGGEKTAAALAYRLALNQVINTIIGVVKTRDLLILDEPTDGFSAEQLDKMRDLLDQLDAKQIILVSHEDRIESFVDNVIRVEKQEHVSRVLM